MALEGEFGLKDAIDGLFSEIVTFGDFVRYIEKRLQDEADSK